MAGLESINIVNLVILLISFLAIVFIVIVELSIKYGKLQRVDTYSYKGVIKTALRLLYIALAISLLVYIFSKSLEVTISIGVLLLFGCPSLENFPYTRTIHDNEYPQFPSRDCPARTLCRIYEPHARVQPALLPADNS